MIKFHCDKCGQKMGVPQEYMGKRVRCTGCKEAVWVPGGEPQAVAAQESGQELGDELDTGYQSDADLDTYDVDAPLDDNPLANQDALAALSGPTDGAVELQSVSEPQAAAGGGSCPKCSALVGPKAVICVQCGHNLKSGASLKTTMDTDTKTRSASSAPSAGRAILALIVGGVVASICGVVWAVIILITGYEIGLIAWGIGGLVGITVAAIVRTYSNAMGIGAAVLALMGLMIGKGIIIGLALAANALVGLADSPFIFNPMYMGYMIEERQFEPELMQRIDDTPEEELWDDQLYADMEAVVEERVAALSEDDRQAFLQDYREMSAENLAPIDPMAEAFSFYDILWFVLALGTAFRVGRGSD